MYYLVAIKGQQVIYLKVTAEYHQLVVDYLLDNSYSLSKSARNEYEYRINTYTTASNYMVLSVYCSSTIDQFNKFLYAR